MQTFTFAPNPDSKAHAIAYLHSPITEMKAPRTVFPCMVVLPGGGYEFCSMREADPVAIAYFAAGYNVILLDQYSIKEEAKNLKPLTDISLTIMAIRDHAEEWGIDPDKIAVCGFSAGGHMAASIGTMWNHPELLKRLDTKDGRNKPNAMVLCYPVLLANEFAHKGTIEHFTGAKAGTPEYAFGALDEKVSSETCPTFLWHTVEDNGVPVENSLYFMLALRRNRIPFECHLFPEGAHGMATCTKEVDSYDPYNARWMEMSILWLNKVFGYTL